MRIKILCSLIKKELTDVIRDKKTLFAMIGMPLLLYPLLMIAFSMIMQVTSTEIQNDTTHVLVLGTAPESFVDFIDEQANELVQFYYEANEGIQNEYTLIFDEDGKVNIEYDSTIEIQGFTTGDFIDFFNEYSTYQMSNALQTNNIELDVIVADEIDFIDIASNTQSFGMLLGQILPMLLLLGVTLGVIYPTIDIVTGEKERNSLETLLSLPITSLEIVSSKFITISICGVVSALLNIISIGFSMWYLIISLSGQSSGSTIFTDLDMSLMVTPLIVTTICLLIFTFFVSATTMAVVSLASSFKEAQNYISPLMIAIMLPSYITMVPTIKLDSITSFIPVINIALLIKEMFTFEFNITNLALVIISNLAYCALAIIILSKVFANENILFDNKKGFRLLENRKNLEKGGVPTLSDGVVLFAVGIVILFYSSGFLASYITRVEVLLAVTQLIIVTLPVIYCFYIKCDFKETFSLRNFNIKYLAIGVPMTATAFVIVLFVQNLMLEFMPSLQSLIEAIEDTVSFESLIMQIIIISILPAICEEMLFRGFLLKSFNVQKSPVIAILATSLLFGVFHMNVLQFITGLCLGSVLGFITYKSKSIYPAMILHFLNNFAAVMISHFTG